MAEVDAATEYRTAITRTYDELSAYVHTRGYGFSAQSLSGTNINAFSEDAFLAYVRLAREVVAHVAAALVGKYLIGLQPLPLDEKFGFNGPAGGFLKEHQVEWLRKLIEPARLAVLQRLSDADPVVQAAVDYFNSLDDLTDEELQKQIEEWDRMMNEHRLPSDPGSDPE